MRCEGAIPLSRQAIPKGGRIAWGKAPCMIDRIAYLVAQGLNGNDGDSPHRMDWLTKSTVHLEMLFNRKLSSS
jgi:hypothetical protein